MFTIDTSLIIPTRNRPDQIMRNLHYFKNNLIFFKEILIVDSSDKNYKKKIFEIKKIFKNIKIISTKPSSALQRNMGLKFKNKKSKYVMFLDDDIYFYKNAFKNMHKSIKKEEQKVSGFSFNIITKRKFHFFDNIKKNFIFIWLNIYSDFPGKVTKSGWHTKISNLKKDTYTDWLSTQAVVYKNNELEGTKFEENFGQYSYLEDLDFSYQLKIKNKKLKVVYKAKYKSPLISNRHGFYFGKVEILNRFLFLKKNSLIYRYFLIGCIFRSLLSLIEGLIFFRIKSLKRFFGNVFATLITMIKI